MRLYEPENSSSLEVEFPNSTLRPAVSNQQITDARRKLERKACDFSGQIDAISCALVNRDSNGTSTICRC